MDLHKTPKTLEDVECLRKAIRVQLDRINKDSSWIPCATCGLCCPLWKLYRCFQCGLWICENCGPKHFGFKRPLMACDVIDSVEKDIV